MQFGYAYADFNYPIYFPIAYNYSARVIANSCMGYGSYICAHLASVLVNCFTPVCHGVNGTAYGSYWMWISIGY